MGAYSKLLGHKSKPLVARDGGDWQGPPRQGLCVDTITTWFSMVYSDLAHGPFRDETSRSSVWGLNPHSVGSPRCKQLPI